MTLPTPVYRVQFNSNYLNGYVQDEDLPLVMKMNLQDNLGANGGHIASNGASIRNVSLTIRVLSRLTTSATALQHLQDCEDQIIENTNILLAPTGYAKLYVGRTTRYLWAKFNQSTMAKSSGDDSKRETVTIQFSAQPFFLDDTALTSTANGNGTLSVTFTSPTSKTYPVFSIPSTLSAAVFTAPDGRTLTFTRGSVTGSLTIDCGALEATKNSDGSSVIETITEVNWGFSYTGTGAFDVDVTGYSGSGTITMTVPQRYPR